MPRPAAALLALVAVFASAAVAEAAQRRVALLQPDEELLRATSIALAPWGFTASRSDAPLPGPSQPEAVQTASDLARRLDVDALVWITPLPQGSLLWVFDARGDVTTRVLSEDPPFESAAAAAVALSVKTVLRDSISVSEPREITPEAPPNPKGLSALELGAGGLWLGDDALDLRLELAGVLWFAPRRRLGISLEISWGNGVRIDDPALDGRYRELAAGAMARFRLAESRVVSATAAVGGAARWASMKGTLTASSLDRTVNRLNGSIDVETAINVTISPSVYVGAALGASYSAGYQRYLVSDETVFSPSPFRVGLAGYAGIELF